MLGGGVGNRRLVLVWVVREQAWVELLKDELRYLDSVLPPGKVTVRLVFTGPAARLTRRQISGLRQL